MADANLDDVDRDALTYVAAGETRSAILKALADGTQSHASAAEAADCAEGYAKQTLYGFREHGVAECLTADGKKARNIYAITDAGRDVLALLPEDNDG